MRNLQKYILIAALIAGLGAAGATLGTAAARKSAAPNAQDKSAPGDANASRLLLLIDKDKDGTISKAEWTNFMAAEFDRMDKDKDGTLDAAELANSRLRVVPAAAGK